MQVPRTKNKVIRHPLNDVRNIKKTENTTNGKRNLRERKVKNYRDSSLSNSSINKSESVNKTDHIPVYLKTALNEDEETEKDPFEFINDTPDDEKKPNRNKGKVRKLQRLPLGSKKGTKKPRNDSWSSDSSFHLLSKAVKRAERKKVNTKVISAKADKNANNCRTENIKNNLDQTGSKGLVSVEKHNTRKINNLNSLMIKKNTKNNSAQTGSNEAVNVEDHNITRDTNLNSLVIEENNKKNFVQTQFSKDFVNVDERIIPDTNLNSLVKKDNYLINRFLESSQFEGVSRNDISTHQVNDKNKELTTNVESSKKLLDLRTKLVVQSNMNSTFRESFRKSVEVAMVKEDDRFFGFDDDSENLMDNNLSNICSTPTAKRIVAIEPDISNTSSEIFKSLTSTPIQRTNVTKRKRDADCSNKIKILSNIALPPTVFKIPQQIPNLNESRQNQSLGLLGFDNSNRRTVQRSPWRNENSNLVRNPHFLQMKNTSLPCYNQEMVLDERLERSIGSKTPKPSDELDKSAKNLQQTSIIDYFNSRSLIIESSPPQKTINQSLFDNDQLSPLKKSVQDENNDGSRARRNILGPINVENISTLKSGNEEISILESSVEDCGIEDCFGFEDEDKENKSKKTKIGNKKNNKIGPMRYSLSELKKVREAVLQDVTVPEIMDENVSDSIEPTVEVLAADEPQNEETTVGLFEDLIEIPDRKSYTRKRPRRVRLPSLQDEEETVEIDKQRRKKRDVRSKSEEEKLNKWAAEFNAMCEEVNQHELETV